MQLHTITQEEKEAFDTQAPHILQTSIWGNFLEKQGKEVALVMGDKGYLISFTPIPYTASSVAYIQKGHMPTEELFTYIRSTFPHTAYIKCEPHIEMSSENEKELTDLGCKKSSWNIFTPYTMYIDLTQDIDSIYRQFNENTKRNIKRAKDVFIEERTDFEAIQIFLSLNKETVKRQGYYTHADDYYTRMWETMTKAQKACMLLAKQNDVYLGAIILFMHNDTLYYPYGASSRNAGGVMARLQFEAMRRAKGEEQSILANKGLTRYDLWGTLAKDANDTTHPLYGVHQFKRGFGGEFVTFVGSYDYIIKSAIYYPFVAASHVRQLFYLAKKKLHKLWK